MPNEIKRMTLVANDDNSVEIHDAQGFMFPPTLIIVFDDFNGIGVFNAGHWSVKEVSQSLAQLSLQIAAGDTRNYKPGTKPDGRI